MEKTLLDEIEARASARLDIIVLHSQKGGPGKTTLACNIAHELAKRGNKTVLIDLDIAQPAIQYIFQIPENKIKFTPFRYLDKDENPIHDNAVLCNKDWRKSIKNIIENTF